MRALRFSWFAFVALALGFGSAAPAYAASLVVAPTTIVLASPGDIGLLYLTNRGASPMSAQIEGFDWSQQGGKDRLDASPDLVLSPPLVKIAPGVTQTVRFQVPASAAGMEHGYRLMVSELPDPATQLASGAGINVLLQFSIPVFVGAPKTAPGLIPTLAWDAKLDGQTLTLSARNTGLVHDKMTELALVPAQASRSLAAAKGLFYVLAGNTRLWQFPAAGLTDGERLRIETRAQADSKPAIADIVVHR